MKATLIFASLFAILTAASPAGIEARQGSIRVQLSDDATDTAVQADIPKTGAKISIKSKFGNLGTNVPANRAGVVSGTGTCNLFKDSGATQKVATIKNGGGDVSFTRQNLGSGVIVCQ